MPHRLYDPDAAKYSTPAEDLKWTTAFGVVLALAIIATVLIVAGLIALL